jgi:cytochrome P450 family 110
VKTRYSLGGYEIPAGLHLGGAILTIHQDESLYPEPSVFRPERFLERRFAPHEFAAFGGGHRHCLGAAFAMNEMKVVLGTLLGRVRLRLAEARPLRRPAH